MELNEFREAMEAHPHSKEILKDVKYHDPILIAINQITKNVGYREMLGHEPIGRTLDELEKFIIDKYS